MRKNVKALAPTLWIVIAAFIIAIFAVWGGAGRLGEAQNANTLASVGKEKISSDVFSQSLRQRLDSLKNEYKDLNKALIQQLNIPQQVLEGMVQQSLILQLAKDMNVDATDNEIRDKIMSYPVFQKDGKFIGFQEYQQILNWNHIPIAEFEENLRKEIILTKIVNLLTLAVTVTPEELWESYQKENDAAKIDYLVLEKDKVTLDYKPSTAELQSYFEKNKAKYKIPEKREAEVVFFKNDDLKKEIKITDADIEKYYKDNLDQFKTPENTNVSRIYLPYETKDKQLVLSEAQSIRDKAQKGEDFAELAKKYSKDDKAKEGGDWGLYDWKSLSQKEQDEIQKLSKGSISGLLELEAGVAILKVTEKEPATTKTLAEVKTRIKSTLEDERARALADERATALEKSARKEKSLDVAAQKMGIKIKKTGLLKKGQSFNQELDPSGSVSEALFGLKEKEISAPIFTYSGVGIAQLVKTEAPRPAQFDEVKQDVEIDLDSIKKKEIALEKIKEIQAKLTDKNWEDIAKEYKLESKTVNEHKREQYLSLIGENTQVDNLIFSLPLNTVSSPFEFEGGYALIKVLERKEATRAEFEKNKETERNKLLETKKNKFLQSFLAKLREEKGVKINYNLFLKLNSDLLSRYSEGE